MRHGKSDWSADYLGDHERPLAPRGVNASEKIGRLVQNSGQLPEHILSSTALRARQTASYFIQGADKSIPIQLVREFYESSPQIVLEHIQSISEISSLMIVGHEPVWSSLAGKLIGDANIAFPTAAIARIDCDISSWSELSFGKGQLRWLLQPKFF